MFNNLESVLLDDMIEKNWEKMEEEEKKAAAKSEEMEKLLMRKYQSCFRQFRNRSVKTPAR